MSDSFLTSALIFSKDRPMQLDATLRSFFMHCLDSQFAQVHVLYKASSEPFTSQYNLLKREYPQVLFHAQKDFRDDTLSILNPFKKYSILFHALNITGAIGFRIGSRLDFIDASPNRCTASRWLVRHVFPRIDPNAAILFLVDDNIFVRDFSLAPALVALRLDFLHWAFHSALG